MSEEPEVAPAVEGVLVEDLGLVAGLIAQVEEPNPLKYFFTAFYSDGTYFNQNPDDVSHGGDISKSSYHDVDHSKLQAFALSGIDHSYVVDLMTGTFIIDGIPFRMHQEEHEVVGPFSLFFCRRHWQSINVVSKEQIHRMVFLLGWQCTNRQGQTIQRVMEID